MNEIDDWISASPFSVREDAPLSDEQRASIDYYSYDTLLRLQGSVGLTDAQVDYINHKINERQRDDFCAHGQYRYAEALCSACECGE